MPAAQRHQRITIALELVGITSRMKHIPAQLSGGQQQRVAIARAIAGEPAFLLADEPTGNLDSATAGQVMDLLERINRMGTTVIMVTHDPELARRASRRVHLIDGQLCDAGSHSRLAASPDLGTGSARASPGP
jgi:putative ABC transport system ATP-binding protein